MPPFSVANHNYCQGVSYDIKDNGEEPIDKTFYLVMVKRLRSTTDELIGDEALFSVEDFKKYEVEGELLNEDTFTTS